MQWARRGFFLGSILGGAFAFRSRWAAGREALRKGAMPRLFFPSAKEGAGSIEAQLRAAKEAFQKAAQEEASKQGQKEAGAKAAEESMREGKGKFFAKAFGFGILGSVIGCVLLFSHPSLSCAYVFPSTAHKPASEQAVTSPRKLSRSPAARPRSKQPWSVRVCER